MEKLNIAEILKDCPKGMELDCAIFEDVHFDYADFDVVNKEIIRCYIQNGNFKTSILFTKYGCYSDNEKAKCVIFPKGKTTWEGFQRPFKDGDVVATLNGNQIFIFKEGAVHVDGRFNGVCYLGYEIQDNRLFKRGRWLFSRHATSEEKQKLFDAIKENGYKWNPETKTLEKLIVPKFKVGDKIKRKMNQVIYTITGITSDSYITHIDMGKFGYYVPFSREGDYELVPDKFDITTLKPFDKVLVRDNNTDKWQPSFWGFYDIKYATSYPYNCCKDLFAQCIPYESNEHLLGTSDDCDEYFKTWK